MEGAGPVTAVLFLVSPGRVISRGFELTQEQTGVHLFRPEIVAVIGVHQHVIAAGECNSDLSGTIPWTVLVV